MGATVASVGEAIRERRLELGLSQKELGRRAGGLTQDYISKLETGIIDTPQRGTMDALAAALQVHVSALYRAAGILEGVENVPDPQRLQLVENGEDAIDAATIVAYIESRPGEHFRRQVRDVKARLTPEKYERWCVALFRAWASNARMAVETFELGD